MNKKAFSFVELLVVVSILAVLGIVAYSLNNSVKQNAINTRIVADIDTIKNGMITYKTDTEDLPLPTGNLNNFKADSSYAHDPAQTFGTFGKITETTLPNKYLSSEMRDHRTKNYYSYGVTKDKQFFDIAGIVAKEDKFVAKISGTYRGEGGPHSLIRQYNGPLFLKE